MNTMSKETVIMSRPLYGQVADLLKEEIASGKLSGNFPTEDELGNRLKVSRVTIRKAMANLKSEGLIRSYRGRGTFVAQTAPKVHSRVLKIASYCCDPEFDIQRQIYKGFEKRFPGLKIESMFCAETSCYSDFLIENLEGRVCPDIFMFSESQFPYLRQRGIFRELEIKKIIGNESLFFNRPFEIFSKNKDLLFGVPYIFSPLALFVNRTYFREGIIPELPTWETLTSVAKKIQKENGGGEGFLLPYETPNRWPLFLLQRGVEIISGKGKDACCMMDSPEAVETIIWLTNLLYCDKITGALCPDSSELFAEGLGAILLSSLYLLNKFEGRLDFDWDVLPVPVPAAGAANLLIITGFGISKSCEYVEAAEQFLSYMLSPEIQNLLATQNVACPVRKSALPYLSPRVQSRFDAILSPEILERSVLLVDHPEVHAIRMIIQVEMNKVWMKLQSPAAGCHNIVNKVKKCLHGAQCL